MARKQVKCESCNGSGYRSAAKECGMQDAPLWAKPVGVWACSDCNGTGKLADIEAWCREMWDAMSPAEQDYLRGKLSEQIAKLNPSPPESA